MTDPQASPRLPVSTARPHWGAEALWQALVPLLPGLSIEVVQTLGSTNSELTDRLRNAARTQGGRRGGDLSPQLLVAINQTAGRGRLGRHWHSTPGSSLTFSLALPLQRSDWSGLSLAVGLAVVFTRWPRNTSRRA
jgi:BirA family biotin operon repressor/biotin-[acetyl-CoA-carboxylase] ligase